MDELSTRTTVGVQPSAPFWSKKKLLIIGVVFIACILVTSLTIYIKVRSENELNPQNGVITDTDQPGFTGQVPLPRQGANFRGVVSLNEEVQECLNEQEISDRCKDVFQAIENGNCTYYDADPYGPCAQRVAESSTRYPQQCQTIEDEEARAYCEQNRPASADYTQTP